MDSTQYSSNQESLSSESADVESSTSQDGSDDGKKPAVLAAESIGWAAGKEASGGRDDGANAKDHGKKKKSNTTAKLKQSKKDIRREQFLAQVAAKSTKGPGLPQPKSEGCLKTLADRASYQEQVCGHASCDSTESGSCHVSSVGTDDEEEALEKNRAASHVSQGTGINEDREGGPVADSMQPLQPSSGAVNHTEGKQDAPSSQTGERGKASKVDAEGSSQGSKKKGKASGPPDAGVEGKPQAQKGAKKGTRGSAYMNGQRGERNGESDNHAQGDPASSSDTGDLEDDWEAAAEEFSKQVAKVAGKSGAEEVEEAGPQPPAAPPVPATSSSSGSSVEGAQQKVVLPVPEYSFRPNQQEVGSRQVPDGCARICAPQGLRPEYTFSGTSFSRSWSANDRAWRPDDVARPQTLPPALSQRPGSRGLLGVPADLGLGSPWRVPPELSQAQWPTPNPASQPACCPICAEELDVTDSSFVPCSCGFRLCLFCHHRIAADDGRCPGCRREYSPDVASRLSKPANLWLRQ